MESILDHAQNKGIKIGEKRGFEIGEKRGLEIGEKRGFEIGEKRGLKIGEKRGIEIGKVEIYYEEMQLSPKEIASKLGKSVEEVNNIISNLKNHDIKLET